ncbi:MAG: hypothetical protein RSD77_09470 [Romboutsia sp.]
MYLALVVFNFLFYKLNAKLGLFKSVQLRINALGEKNKYKLKKRYTMLILATIIILHLFVYINIISGLTIGFLFAFQDICFSDNHIENDWGDRLD